MKKGQNFVVVWAICELFFIEKKIEANQFKFKFSKIFFHEN